MAASAATNSSADIPAKDGEIQSLRLWLQLMKCSKTIEAGVGKHLNRTYQQSLARFDVLSQLYRFGDNWATIGDVAGLVMASSGNITSLLDRMEADGLVVRRANPTDRRSHQLRMTASGHRLFADMTEEHARWIDAALDGVGGRDKERLIALLVKVRRNFETRSAPFEKNA